MNVKSKSGVGQIRNFTDLFAWQKGHVLVLEVYKCTRAFPKEEVYGLTSQMRRCVVSITSNIAEGFSRQSFKEKVQFYSISAGSLTELENQVYISRDVGFITLEQTGRLLEDMKEVQRILHALIRKSKDYAQAAAS